MTPSAAARPNASYPSGRTHAVRPGTGLAAVMMLALAPAALSAQSAIARLNEAHHTSWSPGRELPIAGVSGIARTPDGYLWLASSAGLVRFDGVRFVVFDGREAPPLPTTVPREGNPLFVDRAGTLWIGHAHGDVVRYRDGSFEVAATGLPPITAITEDGGGRVWLLGGGRLFSWERGRALTARLPAPAPDTGITGMARDTGNGLWMGTRTQGLWHVSTTGAHHVGHPHPPGDPYVRPLLQSRDGRLWLAGSRPNVLAAGTWTTAVSGEGIVPTSAFESTDGAVWLATSGHGVVRWRGGEADRFAPEQGLTGAVVHHILADAEGSVWITTEAGLDRLRTAAFVTLGKDRGLPFEAPLIALGDAGGTIWATDYASRRTWRLDGGAVRRTSSQLETAAVQGTDVPFASSRSGGLWLFGLHSDRVYRIRDGVRRDVVANADLAWRGPRRGVEDATGTLWIGSGAGGFGAVRDFEYRSVPLPGIDGEPRVASIAAGRRGEVWVTLRGTPALFTRGSDGTFVRQEATLLETTATHLTPEGGDTLWAIADSRLVRFVGGNAAVVSVAALSTALATEAVVLIASRAHLWIGSQDGIARLPLASLHAAADGRGEPPAPEWFGTLDGLDVPRTNSATVIAGFAAVDGRLWFTTPAGLAVVDPDDIPRNTVAPRAMVETIHVIGPSGRTPASQEIQPNPERVEFKLTTTALRLPERSRLEYRLDGADSDWRIADNTRTAVYTQLRPGDYRFRVRAFNEDGVPSVAEAGVGFRVLPAWYQSPWFTALLLLAVSAIGATVVGAYLRASQRAATARMRERYEAALGERTRVAQELHDTLFQSFMGITMHLQALERSIVDSPSDAARAVRRILGMADAALRETRDTVWDMRSPHLDGRDLPEAVEAAARRTLDGAPTALSFSVLGAPRPLPRQVETTVLRVAREAAANVVRHAEATAVTVTLTYFDDAVRLSIRDDGRGIDPQALAAASGRGHWGVRGMQERAGQAGGTLEIRRRPGSSGTDLELNVPCVARISRGADRQD